MLRIPTIKRLMRLSALLVTAALLASGPSFGQGVDRSASPAGGFEKSDVVPDTTEPWRYYPLAVGNKWEFVFDYYTFYGRFIEQVTDEVSINGTTYFEITHTFFDITIPFGSSWHASVADRSTNLVRFDTLSSQVMVWRDAEQFEEPWNRFWPHWGFGACPFDVAFGDTCPEVGLWIEGGYDQPFVFGGPWPGTGPDTVYTAIKEYWASHGGADHNTVQFAADIGFIYTDGEYDYEHLYYASINGKEYGASKFAISHESLPVGTLHPLEVYPNPSDGLITIALPGITNSFVTYQVYDLLGRRVLRSTIEAIAGSAKIDLSSLPNGTFIFNITYPFLATHMVSIIR